MSIYTMRAAIQAHNLTLSGIRTAPTVQPRALNAADLPCALVLSGPATWETAVFGHSGDNQRRTFIVRVYVKPAVQGTAGEDYETAETLLQTVAASYVADRENDSSIFWNWEISDGGVRGDLTFGDVSYVGFDITVKPMAWEV